MNSTSFNSSIITVVQFSEPTIIPAPTYSDDDDWGLGVGQIVGLVVGCIIGTFLLMSVTYWVFVWLDRRTHASGHTSDTAQQRSAI